MPIPELDPLCFFPENSSSLTRSDHYNVLEFARDIALNAGTILILKKILSHGVCIERMGSYAEKKLTHDAMM